MVEALHQPCAGKGLLDDLGGRLVSEFLRGHAVGIGHIDNRLSLPARQRLGDIPAGLETNSQEDDVRVDCFRECRGNDLGPIAAASAAKLSGSRVVATDTSMSLRANALARARPMLPKPIIA
jgi:hypothetical protein